MKSLLLIMSLVFLGTLAGMAQNVAINNDGSVPHTSAALDIKSTNKGLLIPRLTTAERTAVATPAKGLLVFDTDTSTFWFYNGTTWTNLAAGASFAIPFTANTVSATDVFSLTNNGKGVSIYGRNDGGKAALFVNTNPTNKDSNLVEVITNGNGNVGDYRYGNASSFVVDNTNSVAAAVRGKVNTIFGNFGAAGIFGESAGTGGVAGLFYSSNATGNGNTLVAVNEGNTNAIVASAKKNGNGIESTVYGTGNAVYGFVPSFGTGSAAKFTIQNDENKNDVINVSTVGNGIAGNFKVNTTTGTSAAVKGEVNSIFANFGTAGVYGVSSGTGGYGGAFWATNPAGNGPALIAVADGNGNGITANATNTGDGVETTADGTGSAIYAWTPAFSQGRAARFVNFNTGNINAVLTVETHSTGNLAIFKTGDPGPVNVARINNAGKGFFNGGTQTGGADLAEAFDVTGDISTYEPGDVLAVATSKDRAVEKSTEPYSTLVVGVYATKPGVLLTEEHIDSDLHDKVPMGVVGVIPTKVCGQGGAIKRGDMLVTSSIPGVAMKADTNLVKPGQVIGKALQDFNADGIAKINVLVNVK